jgi:hypothetical protein
MGFKQTAHPPFFYLLMLKPPAHNEVERGFVEHGYFWWAGERWMSSH